MKITSLLEQIVASDYLHASFLKKLSYLERMGYQKLLRYKDRDQIKDGNLMKHLSDEARHAQILKKFYLKLCTVPEEIDLHTKNYLSKLEVKILREMNQLGIRRNDSCYLILTYIIEKRAELFYPQYEEVLKRMYPEISVASIMSDEAEHLMLMERGLFEMKIPRNILEGCVRYENELFTAFLNRFKNFLQSQYQNPSSNEEGFPL
jgi:hypothetical protein